VSLLAVSVSLLRLVDRDRFLDDWRTHEHWSGDSPFLASTWLETLCETLPETAQLYRATFCANGETVGHALFGRATARSRWGSIETLSLTSTGIAEFDSVHIEMNGLLVPEQLLGPATEALQTLVEREMPEVACLHFPGVALAEPFVHAATRARWLIDIGASAAPYVDLAKVRARDGDYCQLLRKKARYAVRKAREAYDLRYGPLRVAAVNDAADIESAFAQLERWNVARWSRSARRSVFETPYFVRFHRALLRRGVPSGATQLVRVFAGARELGCVYLLVRNDRVCFYQSGYDYSLLEQDAQPGFAVLPTVIEYYARLGYRVFDFLADGAQYKRDLATDTRDLAWISSTRATPWNRGIHAARALRRRLGQSRR
jgi:CelD/BcsL family acetyltransferase involved in cellulose biosynthesis